MKLSDNFIWFSFLRICGGGNTLSDVCIFLIQIALWDIAPLLKVSHHFASLSLVCPSKGSRGLHVFLIKIYYQRKWSGWHTLWTVSKLWVTWDVLKVLKNTGYVCFIYIRNFPSIKTRATLVTHFIFFCKTYFQISQKQLLLLIQNFALSLPKNALSKIMQYFKFKILHILLKYWSLDDLYELIADSSSICFLK